MRALSSMYESMTSSQSYYNDLTKLQTTPIKYRRRNLSLPSFVERRLNFEDKNVPRKQEDLSDEGDWCMHIQCCVIMLILGETHVCTYVSINIQPTSMKFFFTPLSPSLHDLSMFLVPL